MQRVLGPSGPRRIIGVHFSLMPQCRQLAINPQYIAIIRIQKWVQRERSYCYQTFYQTIFGEEGFELETLDVGVNALFIVCSWKAIKLWSQFKVLTCVNFDKEKPRKYNPTCTSIAPQLFYSQRLYVIFYGKLKISFNERRKRELG